MTGRGAQKRAGGSSRGRESTSRNPQPPAAASPAPPEPSTAAAASSEVDEEGDSDDDDDYSSVSSTASSHQHIQQHGHLYPAGAEGMLLPSAVDPSERERLRLQHDLFTFCLDGQVAATRLEISSPDEEEGEEEGDDDDDTSSGWDRDTTADDRSRVGSDGRSSSTTSRGRDPGSSASSSRHETLGFALASAQATRTRGSSSRSPRPSRIATASASASASSTHTSRSGSRAPQRQGGGGGGGGGGGASSSRRKRPFRVLDLGTGTGIWPLALSALHAPASPSRLRITGIDVSATALPSLVPANVRFEIDDLAVPGWGSRRPHRGRVDFVHVRNLAGGSVRDWPALFRECLVALREGGQIEVSELRPIWFDYDDHPESVEPAVGSARAGPSTAAGGSSSAAAGPSSGARRQEDIEEMVRNRFEWLKLSPDERGDVRVARYFTEMYRELGRRAGVDLDPVSSVPGWLREAGFEHVVERTELVPAGMWGNDEKMKRKGAMLINMVQSGAVENYTWRLFTHFGYTPEALTEILKMVMVEQLNPEVRGYYTVVFVTARKPRLSTRPVAQDSRKESSGVPDGEGSVPQSPGSRLMQLYVSDGI